jgi:hypothetical protein
MSINGAAFLESPSGRQGLGLEIPAGEELTPLWRVPGVSSTRET